VEVRSKKRSPRAAFPVGTLGALGASVVRKLSDESLLAGLGSGDPDAAAEFLRRFQRRVFGLTLSILRDRAAAEEAAQESFMRAWRHASAYDPLRGTVAAWLLTIARNVSINMLPTRRFDPIDPELIGARGGLGAVAGAADSASQRPAASVGPGCVLWVHGPGDQRTRWCAVGHGEDADPLGHGEAPLAAEGVR
jgi:hypothetical protein